MMISERYSSVMPKTPYKKNEQLQVRIEDIGINGEGIGRDPAGYTLFVKDAVPGDLVDAQITKPGKTYAYARAAKILTPSPWRVAPACPAARKCGGCQLQELSYEKQLEFKEKKVRNDLVRIGGFSPDYIERITEPVLGMEPDSIWRYRNKTQIPVQQDKNGRIAAGFYAGRSHRVIQADDCILADKNSSVIVRTITDFLEENRISTYDEMSGKGCVRHILIRNGFFTGEIMVCIVINVESLVKEEKLATTLLAIPETGSRIKSISLNINKKRGNVILGDRLRVLYGKAFIEDEILNTRFRISPLSFFQVNPLQTQKLYSTAIDFAGLTGTEEVWDLYCGAGTISLCMAGKAAHVTGIEIVPDAVENARENAVINNIRNADFLCGKAEELVLTLTDRPDVVVVDPPRKGLDPVTVDTVIKAEPERIVYVSCNPATLARDLVAFREGGYRLLKVRPVDMFPMTVHVETVCLLTLK